MRILFCNPAYNLSKELGAAKVSMELAEELEQLGWECKIVGLYEIVPPRTRNVTRKYSSYLRRYLRENAHNYDVVEYDHGHLPYPRSEFSSRPLFVARSVLLTHHLNNVAFPQEKDFKSRVRSSLNLNWLRRRESQRRAEKTVKQADLINVANYDDHAALLRSGVQAEKIIVIPYGISRSRRPFFDAVSSDPPLLPKVAFIGTFDSRKGAIEFPVIVNQVCTAVPEATFILLGTWSDQQAVLSRFPEEIRGRIEVIPKYPAERLHEFLAACSVGVFPSYVEGFGFGILEMLAASIPVIAYDSPGPPMMLPSDYLVPRGNTNALSSKVIDLLSDHASLLVAREWAKQQSQHFCWQRIAKQTSEVYLGQLRRRTDQTKEIEVIHSGISS
jgi:glycosyltransferase involved in cell wall biosynthesis